MHILMSLPDQTSTLPRYRTYLSCIEGEVRGALDHRSQFVRGPRALRRGTPADRGPAVVVADGNYVSARRPGDAYPVRTAVRALLGPPARAA